MAAKDGLYINIHRKRERIKRGSGETMRKPGSKGAPTAKAFAIAPRPPRKSAKRALSASESTVAGRYAASERQWLGR